LTADPRLHSALVNLRDRWDGDAEMLERAIRACTPGPEVVGQVLPRSRNAKSILGNSTE
jgi:hypothetical protein